MRSGDPEAGIRPSLLTPGQLLLGLALTIGLVLRIAPVLGSDFPLLDGGLFSTMAHDLRTAHFAIPYYSSFNSGNVPFAYPPLGLYILAAIPGDPVVTERWLPLAYSMLAIGLVYLLARELTDERIAGMSALIFAAMPVTWAIEGAGVTRALGLALLIASVWRVAVVLRVPNARNAMAAGTVFGLALLSHPNVGPPAVASAVLLVMMSPSLRRLLAVGGAGMVAALIAAPWVVLVLTRYGSTAFQTAATAPYGLGDRLLRALTSGPSGIMTFDFVGSFALLGLIVLVGRRDWLLPLWALVLILVPGGNAHNAAMVWAMLAAIGAIEVGSALRERGLLRIAGAVGLASVMVAPFMSGYQRYTAIPAQVRMEIQRAGETTPPGTRFAIVAEDSDLRGLVLDWFPALSGRISLGTSMGLEWATEETFRAAINADHQIQAGELPQETEAVFTIAYGSASWTVLH